MAGTLGIAGKTRKRKTPRAILPIANSVNEAVIATDLDGTVVFWNSIAERVYGWSWEEAVGRRITDLVVPASGQPDASRILAQLKKGKTWTGKFKLRRRDGIEFTAMVTDCPMQDNQGQMVGIIGITHRETVHR